MDAALRTLCCVYLTVYLGNLQQNRRQLMNADALAHLAQELYPIASVVSSNQLASYSDENFHVHAISDDARYRSFVLKIHNDSSNPLHIEMQHAMLQHMAQHGIPVSIPLAGRCGAPILHLAGPPPRIVRALTFIPGTLMAHVPPTAPLRRALGKTVGRLTTVLATFDRPGMHHAFDWDVRAAPTVIRRHARSGYVRVVRCVFTLSSHRSLLAAAAIAEPIFVQYSAALPTCMLHGDLNEHNVLVDANDDAIVGILDVGDCHHGWRVAEVGIACTYQAGLAVVGMDDSPAGDALRVAMQAAADVLVCGHVVCMQH